MPRPLLAGAPGGFAARRSRCVSAALVVSLPALLLGGCSKSPPEPTRGAHPASSPVAASAPPAPVVGETGLAKTPIPSGRCVKALPAEAPKIPVAASPPACPDDPDPSTSALRGEVEIDAPDRPRVAVEIVSSDDDVQRGLMYRRSMPEDAGMFFRLDARREHTFWMHNTCISLDMLFVDEDGLIVGIVEAAPPLDDGTRTVGCPSRYVLEVNAGWSRRHGVRPGHRLTLPAALRGR